MLPSPGAPLSRGDAETACCAALAVVPIIRRQLRWDGEAAVTVGLGGGTRREREREEEIFFFFQPLPF